MADLARIVQRLDDLLETAITPDYPPALNGLQCANSGTISRVTAAVDFADYTIARTIDAGANLLIVHHGMFWSGTQRIVDLHYRRLQRLLANDIAVYSSHLPLDRHPQLGNNAELARALGLEPTEGFGKYSTIDVGVAGDADIPTGELLRRAQDFAAQEDSSVRATPFDRARRTRRWAIVTGAGASTDTLREAVSRGIDTLIVGEGPHHTSVEAMERGLVVIYAGHYATETLGVKRLADLVSREFEIPWSFIAAPTGL